MPEREAEDHPTRIGVDTPPLVGEALSTALRRLIARGRTEIERAAHVGRHRLELRQLMRDRDHFWMRLGKEAYHLVEAGEVDHPSLRKAMKRIDDLETRIAKHRAAMDGDGDPSDAT